MSVLTFADLRERPQGLNLRQHCDLIRSTLAARQDRMEVLLRGAEEAGRDKLLASEQREFDEHLGEENKLQVLLRQLENSPEGQRVDYSQVVGTDGDGTRSGWSVGNEESTYRQDDTRSSWVRDLVAAQLHGSADARDRLVRNNREVSHTTRALTTPDVNEFVPPAWAMNQFLRLARAGRVVADQVTRMPLPPGSDSVSVPRMVTGTAVDEQATQLTDLEEQDATVDSVTAAVATIGGTQQVSLQLIEQSPLQVDQIILGDLLADLAVRTDRFVISNNAANKVGLLNVTGVNAITYTDADPTPAEVYPKIADAVQQIHTNRFLPPTKIFMHPRRWAWLLGSVDANGRPFVLPAAQDPSNALGTHGGVVSQGLAGTLQGLPVYLDANLPINRGTGTNEDAIVVARAEDIVLMEGTPRAEVFREPLASKLGVLLRIYNYVAVSANRQPKSISVISGTGLATPTF